MYEKCEKKNIYIYTTHEHIGFPGNACGKEVTCQCRKCKRLAFNPCIGKIPWRKAWQPTLVFLSGESQGQRSLAGYSPWSPKESDTPQTT